VPVDHSPDVPRRGADFNACRATSSIAASLEIVTATRSVFAPWQRRSFRRSLRPHRHEPAGAAAFRHRRVAQRAFRRRGAWEVQRSRAVRRPWAASRRHPCLAPPGWDSSPLAAADRPGCSCLWWRRRRRPRAVAGVRRLWWRIDFGGREAPGRIAAGGLSGGSFGWSLMSLPLRLAPVVVSPKDQGRVGRTRSRRCCPAAPRRPAARSGLSKPIVFVQLPALNDVQILRPLAVPREAAGREHASQTRPSRVVTARV
jgi:hypothetical protein